MDIINNLKEKAKLVRGKVVLPETRDERMLKATEIILKEDISDVILVGDETQIKEKCEELGINISGAEIIDPEHSELLPEFVDFFFKKREKKESQENRLKLL